MNKPRVLVLTPRLPYPQDKGDRVRIYNLCAELSRHFRLTLLSLCESRREYQMELPADGVFDSIERIYLSAWRSRLNCLFALPTRTPLQVAYYRSAAFARRVQELLASHEAVLCHLVRTAEYAIGASMPRILEMTDAISMNYARMRRSSGTSFSVRKLIFSAEQSRLERFERAIVDEFDIAVLVSDIDRQHLFGEHPGRLRKSLVCSNGVSSTMLPYQFADCTSARVVFIGNMTTVPNMDAVEWFAQTALPLVRERHPQAVLEIIGYIEEAQLRKLEKLPGVRITGAVPSIAEAARGAALGICPMRLGAGVQNKLLEYMALGLPSVTTRIGLEGLSARHAEHLLVADSPTQIAAALCDLLEQPAAAQRISRAARAYVESHHQWSSQIEPLAEAINASLRSAAHLSGIAQ